MSTAILISGQLRTFAKCWPTQRWHVLRHFADPHFFITVQKPSEDPQVGYDILTPLMEEYGIDRVHLDYRTDPDLSEHLTPELTRAWHQAPYANAAPAHQLLLQHWYQNEVWKHFHRHNVRMTPEGERSQFETIIRLRGDLSFHQFDWTDERTRFALWDETCWTPPWGEFGGINDRFAVMGPQAAKVYCTVFERIPELLAAGCPFHPESLVNAALEASGIFVRRELNALFSTDRIDGTRRWPEITPHDIFNLLLRAAA